MTAYKPTCRLLWFLSQTIRIDNLNSTTKQMIHEILEALKPSDSMNRHYQNAFFKALDDGDINELNRVYVLYSNWILSKKL